jgi:dephospho-CoA kinase
VQRVFSVGLTGGVASGKSLVARQFVRLGAELVDTDEIAREVVVPGEPGLAALRQEFGSGVITPAAARPARAASSCSRTDKRRHLETLLHHDPGPHARPARAARVPTRSSRCRCSWRPTSKLVDRVLVVDAPGRAARAVDAARRAARRSGGDDRESEARDVSQPRTTSSTTAPTSGRRTKSNDCTSLPQLAARKTRA